MADRLPTDVPAGQDASVLLVSVPSRLSHVSHPAHCGGDFSGPPLASCSQVLQLLHLLHHRHIPDRGAANVPRKAGLADLLAAIDPAQRRQRPVPAAGARVPGVFRAQRKLLHAVSVRRVCVLPLSGLRQHQRDRLCAVLHQRPKNPLQGRHRPLSENVQRAVASRRGTHGGAARHGVRAPAAENGDFLATAASSVLCAKPADAGAAGRRGGVQQAQIRPVQVHPRAGDAVRRAHRPDALVAGGAACGEKHRVRPAPDARPPPVADPAAEKVRRGST